MKSLRKCGVLLITIALLASLAACNREPQAGPGKLWSDWKFFGRYRRHHDRH